MYRIPALIYLMLLVVLIPACAPLISPPISIPPTPLPTEALPVMGVAVVQNVDVQILENSPLQVNAIIRGQLPDAGCTRISSVDQIQEGNIFRVTLMTTTDPLALCALALTPFEHVITLDVANLPPANYVVNANGIERSFRLFTRDMTSFKQLLVQALNAQDYETLRLMMDQSLTVALWRAEGNVYDVEMAIEQLKLNHPNANTSITADLAKDLTTLPSDTGPLSVFGLDVGPNHALFVSGWGPDGKDEAILYMNYLLDGTLYWHGILIAKGGFAQTIPVTGPNPTTNSPAPAPVSPALTTEAIPTIAILSVLENDSVTIRANNFPSDTKFDVFMGKMGTNGLNGIKVDSVNSRNGSTFTATFEIPRKLRGEDQIAIRLESDSGYYSYNWFKNITNDTIPGDPQNTKVKYVKSLDYVVIRVGPGAQYRAFGTFAKGQIAKVIGVSLDGKWWSIVCPKNTGDICWVSAKPDLTKPVDSAGNN